MTSLNYLLIDWSTFIVWQAALLCIPCVVHVAIELYIQVHVLMPIMYAKSNH